MMFRLVPLSALGDFVNSSYFTPDYAGGFVEYTGAAWRETRCVTAYRPHPDRLILSSLTQPGQLADHECVACCVQAAMGTP